MSTDYAFEMGTSNLRFGPGSTHEVGMDLSEMGIRRVLLVADPNLTELPPVQTAIASIEKENVDYCTRSKG